MDNFDKFLFRPGMLFGSPDEWWGTEGERLHPHEGIDLCEYSDTDGKVHLLPCAVKIPVVYEGRVAKITDDFMGKSVFVRHRIYSKEGAHEFCTVYGHTQPVAGLHEGSKVAPAEPIATLSESFELKSKIPPHLHLTLAWMPRDFPDHQLAWQAIRDMTLSDPLKIFPDKYLSLK